MWQDILEILCMFKCHGKTKKQGLTFWQIIISKSYFKYQDRTKYILHVSLMHLVWDEGMKYPIQQCILGTLHEWLGTFVYFPKDVFWIQKIPYFYKNSVTFKGLLDAYILVLQDKHGHIIKDHYNFGTIINYRGPMVDEMVILKMLQIDLFHISHNALG